MTLNDSSVSCTRRALQPEQPLRVIHFTDAADAADNLWGKEKVILSLMEAQRASGRVQPELVTFTPGLLGETLRAAGFRVHALEPQRRRFSFAAYARLRAILSAAAPAVLHTHEYKANILARVARATGAPMRRLVSTCHGWVDRSPQLDVYFELDRRSAIGSDTVTVTDPAMIERFPRRRPRRLVFVQNGIAAGPGPTADERAAARRHFGFAPDATVIGSLGRLTQNKGILDILAAARRTQGTRIVWAIAGSGALGEAVRRCGLPNVAFVEYQADSTRYLAALDVYLQASYFEGLSMSLLEAMRARLPSISTRAGATELAVRDRIEALLVDAGHLDAIVAGATELHADPALRAKLGVAARVRFDGGFTIERQHESFLELYRG